MSLYNNILRRLGQDQSWPLQSDKAIKEPYTYTVSAPGKGIRQILIDAFNIWLNVPEDKLVLIKEVVDMLHNASLLIDDIEDDSQLRRGQPAAHKVYGVPRTMNAAHYIWLNSYKEIAKIDDPNSSEHDSPRLANIITDEMIYLHRGQGLDLFWRDTITCPSEEEYIAMVNNKTSGLLRLAIRLMMACATTNKDRHAISFGTAHTQINPASSSNYVPLVNLIGVYFQIRDDLMNLDSTEYAEKKGFAEDLTEGKFSFPIIHGIQADTSNPYLIDLLRQRPTKNALKIRAIEYLRHQTKSFEYTQEILDSLEIQAFDEIRQLGGNWQLDQMLRLLHVNIPKPESAPTDNFDELD